MCVRVLVVFDDLLISFPIVWWTSAGKELTSWLYDCSVLLYAVFIFVFLSRIVSGEGSGIRLYRFLIIAFSSTEEKSTHRAQPTSCTKKECTGDTHTE